MVGSSREMSVELVVHRLPIGKGWLAYPLYAYTEEYPSGEGDGLLNR